MEEKKLQELDQEAMTNTSQSNEISEQEIEKITGGVGPMSKGKLVPFICCFAGCNETVMVDVRSTSSFTCPNGHVNYIEL